MVLRGIMHMELKYNKRLSELIENAPDIKIEHLFTDSRKGANNGIFFCIKGIMNDGHKFVDSAIEKGAVCIIHCDELKEYQDGVLYYKVEDVDAELNRIASLFYEDPSSKLQVFGVTGTNGKTTVTSLIQDILNPKVNTGYIGTINISYNNKTIAAQYTTPEVIDLQRVMSEMVNENVKALAIEVSSHALIQKRVMALKVDYPIFTNLTHEHLDYHGTMEHYFEAKAELFKDLSEEQCAIINVDDEYGKRLIDLEIPNFVTYGIDNDADYRAINAEYAFDQTSFTLVHQNKEYEVLSNLVAKFNLSNLLAAIAALHQSGLELEYIISRVSNLKQISGRVERINFADQFQVIVDYAHTPDGFESLFRYAKSIVGDKRIISVFGSAGERDILKRKVLGEIANEYSDMIILTADDPRNESVADISKEIAEGIDKNYIIIENRYDAIYQAIQLANKCDIILVLGKGNDQYMALESGKEPYIGDVNIVNEILEEYEEVKERENDEQIY